MIENKEHALFSIQILDHYNSMIQEIEKLGLIEKLVSNHHIHGRVTTDRIEKILKDLRKYIKDKI